MKFYNIKHPEDGQVGFSYALMRGLGRNQGLFFPIDLPKFTDFEIKRLLDMDFISRSVQILFSYIGDELSLEQILKFVSSAFTFSVPVLLIKDNLGVLELFHGPTLAFKDFGARFMAQVLSSLNQGRRMTILTATSGDTGAAVAHAFYGIENIQVIILYPKNKVSVLQEKLFCTLGKNIHTLAIDGDFDVCQSLVKTAFDDYVLKRELFLNSANSINVCRLLAQICYFFEAIAQLSDDLRKKVVVSVPSGNFGNLTAGLLAKSLGLPIHRFIAATNINNTVPRFLDTGHWEPRATVPTLSNAMDVSYPNNWERIMVLFQNKNWQLSELSSGSVSDASVSETIRRMIAFGYLSEPHAATAYHILDKELRIDEFGLFLATAHPAKFKEIIENIIGKDVLNILLPDSLKERMLLPSLSICMSANFDMLRTFILDI